MNERMFWHIIDSTLAVAGDREAQEALLWEQLACLPPQEVAEFAWLFEDQLDRAEDGNGLEAWEMWCGVGSDDGFHDFRCWLISRGQAVFEAALRDPKSLEDVIEEDEDTLFQDFGYIGIGVYEQLTGEDCPDRPESWRAS